MEKVNGRKTRRIQIVISIRATMKTTRNTAMDNLTGKVETTTSENIEMISAMVMVKCTGKMAVSTKVTGSKACSTASVQ